MKTVLLWLLLPSICLSQELKLPAEIPIKKGTLPVVLTLTTTAKNIIWDVTPEQDVKLIPFPDGKTVIIFVSIESKVDRYRVRAITAKADMPLMSNSCYIITGNSPIPPGPDPKPPEPDFDELTTKLYNLYKASPDPLTYSKLATFYDNAADTVNTLIWPTTERMTTDLKAKAKIDLGDSIPQVRILLNEYLVGRFGMDSKIFTDELRAKWVGELKYIALCIRRASK